MEGLSSSILTSVTSHSAVVGIALHIDGRTFQIVQASHKEVKPAKGVELPAGTGCLEVTVDGVVHRRTVFLPVAGNAGEWTAVA